MASSKSKQKWTFTKSKRFNDGTADWIRYFLNILSTIIYSNVLTHIKDVSTIKNPRGVIKFSSAKKLNMFDIPRIKSDIPPPGTYNPQTSFKKVFERPKSGINYGRQNLL